MDNNFKMSLVIASPLTGDRQCDALRTKIEIWLSPKLISECAPNSDFSTNHEDNENDQDNENHPDNKNKGNYPTNKYMLTVNNRCRL